MEQKEFTDYIIPKLIGNFPMFASLCKTKPDHIVDIDIKSSNEKLILWITTQDKEITVGFTGDTDCDWHTHMNLFGANTPDEELQAATELIDNILNDEELIFHSNLRGYFLADNINEVEKYLDQNEKVQVYKWSDL